MKKGDIKMRNELQIKKNKIYNDIMKKVKIATKGFKPDDVRRALNYFYQRETLKKSLLLRKREIEKQLNDV